MAIHFQDVNRSEDFHHVGSAMTKVILPNTVAIFGLSKVHGVVIPLLWASALFLRFKNNPPNYGETPWPPTTRDRRRFRNPRWTNC